MSNTKALPFKRIILLLLSLLAIIITGVIIKDIILYSPLDYSIGMHLVFILSNVVIILAFVKQKMFLFIVFPICSLLMFLVSLIIALI